MTESYFARPGNSGILAPGFSEGAAMHKDKGAILAQNPPPAPVDEGWTPDGTTASRSLRLRWLIALSTLPLLGMAVAFGIAPA
ncbi:MAG: hypothetical protein WHV61_12005, partial [Burkholderiales bacterium]